jgi:type II secretory pathway component PulF
MKLLAILCIGFAAYLWFPLPNGILQERKSDEKHATPKSDPLRTESRPASTSEVLQALQVIQLGISSGMTIGDAVSYAQTHSPPPAAQDLEQALNQFRMGLPLTRSLDEMAMRNPNWRSTTDTLITALNSGTQISDHLVDVEFVLQSAIDTEKLKRIKSVAVKSVLPLGLCFLPAFILLAVVPIVASLLIGITK